jgi:hypothetical protein
MRPSGTVGRDRCHRCSTGGSAADDPRRGRSLAPVHAPSAHRPRRWNRTGRSGTSADASRPSLARGAPGREGSSRPQRGPGSPGAPRRSRADLEHIESATEGDQFLIDAAQVGVRARGPGDQHDVEPWDPRVAPCRLAQEPLRAVATDGVPDLPGGDDGQPGLVRPHRGRLSRSVSIRTPEAVDRQQFPGTTPPAAQDALDVRRPGQPSRTDRCGCWTEIGHAVSLARPRRRRLFTIARPARVRIRERKPCLRERRRLFGW